MAPVQGIITRAIAYIQKKDPSWNKAQPVEFRAKVVEQWKNNIKSELFSNSVVCWSLTLGDVSFCRSAPLFTDMDWEYNPYQEKAAVLFKLN